MDSNRNIISSDFFGRPTNAEETIIKPLIEYKSIYFLSKPKSGLDKI